jgi:NADH-quinone oxidoreductase subunit M
MNILIIGLYSGNYEGVSGAIFMMLNHGIVSSGLFLTVGVLYDRYHSRLIFYYKGLSRYMPIYNFFFILMTLANIALPGTSSFVSEFIILLGIFNINFLLAFIISGCCITSAIYGLWLYSRIMLGNVEKEKKSNFLIYFCDITEREILVFLPLTIFVIVFGVVPSLFYNIVNEETLINYIISIR